MPTPERTSAAQIVRAARELLELGGPARVTMKDVAERVGVRAPSLYKRVRDREALLDAVVEATIDDLATELEASDGSIAGLAHAYRSFAHAHPEGFRLMFAHTAPLAALDRAASPILRAVRELTDDALNAARLVTAWATGFVQMELAGAFRLGGDVDEAFDFGLAQLQAGLTPGARVPSAGREHPAP